MGSDDDINSYCTPNFVQPAELDSADIVLTTYTVLQREIGWASVSAEQRVGEGHRPSLRLAQRYLAPPSPLTCVIWWRVGLYFNSELSLLPKAGMSSIFILCRFVWMKPKWLKM